MSETKKNTREPSIELLRVIAMLMVTALHALLHGGMLDKYNLGIGYILFWSIKSLSYVSVNIFVLISGYFMIKSSAKPSRIIKLAIQVWTFSIGCAVISHFVFERSFSLHDLAKILLPLTGGTYWFASAYAVMILLVPILNKFIFTLNRTSHLRVLALLIAVFCVLTTVFPWSRTVITDGYSFTWFIVLYFTAAYIRLYKDENSTEEGGWKRYKPLYAYFALCFAAVIGKVVLHLTIGRILNNDASGILFAYNSVVYYPASICLFAAFRRMRLKNRVLCKISTTLGAVSFGAYLATDNPFIRSGLWNSINLPKYVGRGVFIEFLIFIGVIAALFLIGCAIEWLRCALMRLVRLSKLLSAADRRFEKLKLYLADKLRVS